ncbi:MAG: hypothetical protein WC768_04075 [Patescibacteria group bacterium]|jgi:hypothetical protein
MGFRRPDQAAMSSETGPAVNEEYYHPLNKAEEEVYRQALSAENQRPKIIDDDKGNNSEFAEVFSAEVRALDQGKVERIKRQQEGSRTMRSSILEYIIHHHAEASDWVAGKSGECYTSQTTEFDDIFNHTDMVFEWSRDGKIYRLAVDVTSSEKDERIQEKEAQIRKEIEAGTLGSIKYFKSQIEPEKIGRITNVPKVIIAFSREMIQRLCGDLATKKPKELAKSPEQLLILEEISQQMTDQIEYALGLILEETEKIFLELNQREQRELKAVLRETVLLAQNPENLAKVLATLDQQSNLLGKLQSHPTIRKYLSGINRQREIQTIVNGIIEEKEKSGEVQAPAASSRENNIVLKRVKSRLTNFGIPPGLEDILQAA